MVLGGDAKVSSIRSSHRFPVARLVSYGEEFAMTSLDRITTLHLRLLRTGALAIAMLGTASPATVTAQTTTQTETERSVEKMLERLPYYGVFDFLAYAVDHGTVTLVGYSFQPALKSEAEMATKRASGVTEVANRIEVLPTSQNDDRIRWETFFRIYTDDFLSRYAPGGSVNVFQELRDERHFPGMQPVGNYPIHIIVKNGRTMLLGVVDSAVDRQLADVRAREVTGAFEVDNGLIVAGKGKDPGTR
jgi:hyperosmotically inducible periplasmic protein